MMSANKQRDWVDYAGLASQVYQNHQLNEVGEKLKAMGQVALLKEAREAAAQQAQRGVDQAKEALFRFWSIFGKVKKNDTDEPHRKLLFALKLRRFIRDCGLDTSRFPDFADKERLVSLFDDIDDYVAHIRAGLGEADREAVDTCDRYRQEMAQLDELIESKAKQEVAAKELESKRRRFEEIKDVEPSNGGKIIGIIGGLIGGLMTMMSASVVMEATPSAELDEATMMFWAGLGLLALSALLGSGMQGADSAKQRNALYEERQRLAAMLESESRTPGWTIEADEEIMPPTRESIPLTGIDESLSATELAALRRSRLEFILELTGESEADWVFPSARV